MAQKSPSSVDLPASPPRTVDVEIVAEGDWEPAGGALEHDGEEWEPVPTPTPAAHALSPLAASTGVLGKVQAQDPARDPVTAYLSRYTSRHSRLAMASSLGVLARYLTGRDTDPREIPWASIRYPHAQEIRARLVNDYAWASVNRHLLALRGIVRECWRLGLIEHEVAERVAQVEGLKSNAREVGRALSGEEIDALYGVCDGSVAGRRNGAVVTLTAYAGMRRSEVCGLQLENWDAAEGKLSILGKGNKWRTVYLGPKAAGRLESWLAVRGTAPGAFITPVSKHDTVVQGKPLTSSGLYVLLQSIGTAAKVKDFTPHDLRRTYITRLLDKGADALTVSKLAGHESVQTTMRYDKRGERAKKATALLDD